MKAFVYTAFLVISLGSYYIPQAAQTGKRTSVIFELFASEGKPTRTFES